MTMPENENQDIAACVLVSGSKLLGSFLFTASYAEIEDAAHCSS